MSKNSRWLLREVDRWTAEKIISPEQAAAIRALYAEPAGGPSWGLIVFFGLGAIVIGLGVILLFAYNWAAIPKVGKLALIFGLVALAHGGGLWMRGRAGWQAVLGEALSLVGTMAFGAGIWLVAQIYHIDEHFPTGFLIWAGGALAMAWALGSVAQGVLAAVLLAVWGGAEVLEFHTPVGESTLALVLGVGPLVWRLRSVVLLAVTVVALYWLLLCNAGHWGGAAGVFGNALALSTLLIALARLGAGRKFPDEGRRVLTAMGWGGFLLCAYILGFHGGSRALLRAASDGAVAGPVAWLYRWLLFGLSVAAWAWLLARLRRDRTVVVRIEEWLCPVALIYGQGLRIFAGVEQGTFVAAVFNLVCLGVATAWMVRGCRDGSLRLTVIGSLLLSVVVAARYFDLFHNLALRGLVFLIFGGILFAEGFFYRRLRRIASEVSSS